MLDLPCVACNYFDIEFDICTFEERNIEVDPFGCVCGDFVGISIDEDDD